jgi:hypothetical protein
MCRSEGVFAVEQSKVDRNRVLLTCDSDPLLRENLFQLLGNVIKASLEQQDGLFGAVPPLTGSAMSLQELDADMKECDHRSCTSAVWSQSQVVNRNAFLPFTSHN